MSFFQHPAVKDILTKRVAYEKAKEAFLFEVLSNPAIYTESHDTVTYWLDACVNDKALQKDICAWIAAGPPMLHWGDNGVTACEARQVVPWHLVMDFSEVVTCRECREVQARDKITNFAYRQHFGREF
jgi:hypothetical protein